MTTKEFKLTIAESKKVEWYNSLEAELIFEHIDFEQTFTGIISLFEFLTKQVEGFSSIEELPVELKEVKEHFEEAIHDIEELTKDDYNSDYKWEQIVRSLNKTRPSVFLFNYPETEFLLKVAKEHSELYLGAYEYLTGNTGNATNKDYLSGYILAYEFVSKDFSAIAERKDSEKKSLNRIRSDFHKLLEESEIQQVTYLSEAKKKYEQYSTKIDLLKNEKESTYENWFGETSGNFEKFFSDTQTKVSDLEKLYREKLKLEAPAKYWHIRARRLKKEGRLWLAGLILSISSTVFILLFILNSFSDDSILKIFEHTGTAIKWSILLITTVSFLAFGIKAFSKLTYSSFHLMRDAEEREQLTYVYLALQKEQDIDESERHLIMQSLFSRADSGLLKDEGSPAMPGIMDKLIQR